MNKSENKNNKKILMVVNFVIFLAFVFPVLSVLMHNVGVSSDLVFAQTRVTNTDNLTFENPLGGGPDSIYSFVKVIIDFIIKLLSAFIVLAIIYSGFLFIQAQGNESKITEAKKTFFYSVLGGLIILASWYLVGVICNTVSGFGANVDCNI